MLNPESNRRQFLQTAALGAAALSARSYGRVKGANERIRIGNIGCGRRGFRAHMKGVQRHAEAENLQIAAVCDVWREHRQQAVDQTRKWFGETPFETTDYRAVLDREDIDAVMIATCDFHHAKMLRETAEAGKDVYCEKPVAMDVPALKAARDAVTKSDIVVQIGTQRRNEARMRGVRKLLEDDGLGKLSRIEFFRNSGKPNWYKRLSRMPIPAEAVDWKQFLMDLPDRPFSDLSFAGWYGYREFCSGSIGQFMSHYADLVNFITGSTFPLSAVAHGKTFIWDDEYDFDCRDQVQVSLIYPAGFLMTYSTNFGNPDSSRSMVYGTDATLDLDGKPTVSPVGGSGKDESEVEAIEGPDHFLDWFRCLRSRKQPVAPIEAGYQHSIACIMADRAMRTGERQVYDAERDIVRAG